MFVSSEDGIFQRFYGAFSTNGNSGMVYPITSLNYICKTLNFHMGYQILPSQLLCFTKQCILNLYSTNTVVTKSFISTVSFTKDSFKEGRKKLPY